MKGVDSGFLDATKPGLGWQDFFRVRLSALGTGTPWAAGSLPGGGTYAQAAGSNQTEETVRTGVATVARWAFVANLPRIGYSPAGRIGLYRDPPRTNIVLNNRAIDNASWTAGASVVTTADYAAGPDGVASADRSVVTSGGYSRLSAASVTIGQKYTASLWLRHATGSGPYKVQLYTAGGGAGAATPNGIATTSWSLVSATITAGGTVMNFIPADGTNYNGVGPSALDTVSDLHQWELGEYPSSVLPTAGSSVARAGSRAALPLSSLVRAGRLRYRQSLDPLGAADKYASDGAAVRLWTIDANTYAEIATATRVLTVCVNGVARVAGVAVGWSHASCVEWSWEVGGGALRVRYRLSTDGGATWTLPFDPFGGTIHTDAAISTVATSLHTLSDGVSAKYLGAVEIEHERMDVIPSWVLQALPTDVASVKAFFRADGGVTLNSTTASAWGGQTAAAVTPFTQGTGAAQPTFVANGFATARPSLRFDGSSDYMSGENSMTVLSASAAYVYALWAPISVIRDVATIYANDGIVTDSGGYWGIFQRANNPRVGAFNYDTNIDETTYQAISLGTKYVGRLRHTGGKIALALNGVEGAEVASGATAWGAGPYVIRIGAGHPGTLYHSNIDLAAVVFANAVLSAADDAAIMSFMNAYGGLS